MMRAAEQGPKREFKIEISLKNFGYSVKFDMRKKEEKINGFYKNVGLLPRLDLEKNLTRCDC